MVLAIDSGTTSCRTLAFDASGRCVALAQQEFTQHYPQPGWVEHDPEEIWRAQKATLDSVVAQVGKQNVQAIGITNQRETIVAWDKHTGEPLAPAIVWQCRRTTEICQQLKDAGHEPWVRSKTGLLLDPYFSGTKIEWLSQRIPTENVYFGTIDTWLLWKLTDGKSFATDPSNASRTLLYNLHTNDWDEELLGLFGVARTSLPMIQPSGSVFGHYDGIPICGILGDQQAALYGQQCIEPGMAKCTYGTGCFLLKLLPSSLPPPGGGQGDGILQTVAWEKNGEIAYAAEGAVFVAGAAVQWLRDGLGLIESATETEALARSVPDSGGVVFVPAFTGLGAPYWNPEARGLICGLTRGTTKAHLVYATLEAIAQQNADLLEAMSGIQTLRVDGGASRNNFLMQLQADLLGIPVERPAETETTAFGAALMAGQTIGFFGDTAPWRAERIFLPQITEGERAHRRETWRQAVARAL
ncbi:glycerol kinase GlpK [Armatimonas sp.]|uniref:glycerol kinase GlpK n=1 Tax=Armatimonas sp. TaxID=1872638 RepID=UPI003753BCB5